MRRRARKRSRRCQGEVGDSGEEADLESHFGLAEVASLASAQLHETAYSVLHDHSFPILSGTLWCVDTDEVAAALPCVHEPDA